MATVPTLTLATIVALMLNSTLRFSTTYRVIYLIPNVTSMVAMGILFSSLFSSQFGIANAFINLFGFDNVAWLQNEWGIKIAISALTTWSFVGYNSLLILAGLQAIDKTQYESAAIDGANGWRTFFQITLPQLRSIVLFITLMSTIGSLQSFTEAQVLTSSSSVRCRVGGRRRQLGPDDGALLLLRRVPGEPLRLWRHDRLGRIRRRHVLLCHQLARDPWNARKGGTMSSMNARAVPAALAGAAIETSGRPRHRSVARRGAVFRHLALIVGALISLFPFYWMFVLSTHESAVIFQYPPVMTPGSKLTTNYGSIMERINIWGAMSNTLVVATSVTVLVLLVSSLAAFAFSKFEFPGRNLLFAIVLGHVPAPVAARHDPPVPADEQAGVGGRAEGAGLSVAGQRVRCLLAAAVHHLAIPRSYWRQPRIDGCGFLRAVLARLPADHPACTGVPRHVHLHRFLERLHVAADRAERSDQADAPGGAEPAEDSPRHRLRDADGLITDRCRPAAADLRAGCQAVHGRDHRGRRQGLTLSPAPAACPLWGGHAAVCVLVLAARSDPSHLATNSAT